MSMIGIIGGSGLDDPDILRDARDQPMTTRWGEPSADLRLGSIGNQPVALLARHGRRHTIPPSQVNYRANLQVLKDIGATRVLALNTVGGITDAYGPRVLACPDQLIDYTWGRVSTLCEEPGSEVLHIDFGEPYTAALRTRVADAAAIAGVPLQMGGCYGATQGPRLETRAEIARMRRDGCDLVGMTGMPEAGLARELGLDYACLAIVANWAAGAGPDPDEVITLQDVLANVAAAMDGAARILRAMLGDRAIPPAG